MTIDKSKTAAVTECILVMALLQGMRMGVERLLAAGFAALSAKMLTMCAMLLLWPVAVAYIRLRRAAVPVFPKPFSRRYVIATAAAAALLISAPLNYVGGVAAILELLYGSIVTPVFEETIFRGYFWERLQGACGGERLAFILTTLLFTVWHIGYMLVQLAEGNWFAVGTKLAAALLYGAILGFARLKWKMSIGK